MSSLVRKIQGQIDKLRVSLLVSPRRIPVLLCVSDSKGFNLQKQAKVNPEIYIKFWCDAGATVENTFKFLKENLEWELQRLNCITFYVWVGTWTTKEGNYIYLTAKDHTAVDDIKKGLREIYSFTREFGNRVMLVFLNLPLYSIVQFNLYNEYEGDITDFVKEDKILQQQITEVNFFINDTNMLFHATNPNFFWRFTEIKTS